MFVAGELQSNLEPAYSRQRSRAACVDSTASTSASSSQLTGKGVTTFVERQLRFTYAAESRNESAAIPLLLQPLTRTNFPGVLSGFQHRLSGTRCPHPHTQRFSPATLFSAQTYNFLFQSSFYATLTRLGASASRDRNAIILIVLLSFFFLLLLTDRFLPAGTSTIIRAVLRRADKCWQNAASNHAACRRDAMIRHRCRRQARRRQSELSKPLILPHHIVFCAAAAAAADTRISRDNDGESLPAALYTDQSCTS